MRRESYQVEILHILNPYMIWLEVKSSQPAMEVEFEQVGIYGILPLSITLDIFNETLMQSRSDKWIPAASVFMKHEFLSAKEIRFVPKHEQESKTLFDDNLHQYGEIILITPEGKQKKLSKLLVEKKFAFSNVSLFHEELNNGSLERKLNIIQAKEVIRQIECFLSYKDKTGHLAKCMKNQTVVLQTALEIESALIAINIENHKLKHENEIILHKKLEDLELCKGVDINKGSVGRAVNSIKLVIKSRKNECTTVKTLSSKYLSKKLSLFISQNSN